MKFGVQMFPADYAIPVTRAREGGRRQRLRIPVLPEHTHIPASRESPWPGGADLPQEYWHTLDPFAALGAVAGVTKDLMLGTGICLVIERDPITLAKEVATVDHISNGRFLFGIGGGWNREEMQNHGTDPKKRWRILRERILAMKQIWTDDEAEYHGDYVDFDRIWSWPKPVQKPHPPILVGGDGPNTLDRVVEYGDGWIPIGARSNDLEEKIQRLQQMAKDAGKKTPSISIFGAPSKPEVIEGYQALGVDRVIFGLPPAPAEMVLPALQKHAEAIKAYV
ncbi:MAG: LLM class F420-dependent oxidoreductase [Dehalococcoidia bacterium]|nr:LLM class F420-dependent oxidoreductase [Dehalococcoidia bacterium]